MQNCEFDNFALGIADFLFVFDLVFVLCTINLVLIDLKTIFKVDIVNSYLRLRKLVWCNVENYSYISGTHIHEQLQYVLEFEQIWAICNEA